MSRESVAGPVGPAEDQSVKDAEKPTKVDTKDMPRTAGIGGTTQPLADAGLDIEPVGQIKYRPSGW